MRKNYVFLLAAILISAGSFAQKGKSYLGVGADLSLPMGDFGNYFKTGVGGYVKAMFGVGNSDAVTFTTGYTGFKGAGDFEDVTATQGVVPILLGYRHNFNGFFVEPQIGYGLYPYKETSTENGFYSESGNAFTWAAGVGYVFNNKVEVSARYQNGSADGVSLGMFGLRLGYNFSLSGSR
jgi:hypothetical protein